MRSKPKIVIISAPSGTGKTSVVKRLLTCRPQMVHSISCTTRAPRTREKDGVDYFFIDEETFRKRISVGEFVEWAQVHGYIYGTPKKPLEENLARGKDVVLDLDVQGGLALKKAYPHALSIFLLPPSEEELTKRLRERKTDAPQEVKKRLEVAHQEMGFKDRYDVQLINDDLEKTCQKILALMEERARAS